MYDKVTKESYLRLTGREAYDYAKSKLDDGSWNLEQFKKMMRFWTEYHQ